MASTGVSGFKINALSSSVYFLRGCLVFGLVFVGGGVSFLGLGLELALVLVASAGLELGVGVGVGALVGVGSGASVST